MKQIDFVLLKEDKKLQKKGRVSNTGMNLLILYCRNNLNSRTIFNMISMSEKEGVIILLNSFIIIVE